VLPANSDTITTNFRHCMVWHFAEILRPCSPSTQNTLSLVDILSVGVDRMQRNF